jgi:hypothetical protein
MKHQPISDEWWTLLPIILLIVAALLLTLVLSTTAAGSPVTVLDQPLHAPPGLDL